MSGWAIREAVVSVALLSLFALSVFAAMEACS